MTNKETTYLSTWTDDQLKHVWFAMRQNQHLMQLAHKTMLNDVFVYTSATGYAMLGAAGGDVYTRDGRELKHFMLAPNGAIYCQVVDLKGNTEDIPLKELYACTDYRRHVLQAYIYAYKQALNTLPDVIALLNTFDNTIYNAKLKNTLYKKLGIWLQDDVYTQDGRELKHFMLAPDDVIYCHSVTLTYPLYNDVNIYTKKHHIKYHCSRENDCCIFYGYALLTNGYLVQPAPYKRTQRIVASKWIENIVQYQEHIKKQITTLQDNYKNIDKYVVKHRKLVQERRDLKAKLASIALELYKYDLQ